MLKEGKTVLPGKISGSLIMSTEKVHHTVMVKLGMS
jgi:hypothetical protein